MFNPAFSVSEISYLVSTFVLIVLFSSIFYGILRIRHFKKLSVRALQDIFILIRKRNDGLPLILEKLRKKNDISPKEFSSLLTVRANQMKRHHHLPSDISEEEKVMFDFWHSHKSHGNFDPIFDSLSRMFLEIEKHIDRYNTLVDSYHQTITSPFFRTIAETLASRKLTKIHLL